MRQLSQVPVPAGGVPSQSGKHCRTGQRRPADTATSGAVSRPSLLHSPQHCTVVLILTQPPCQARSVRPRPHLSCHPGSSTAGEARVGGPRAQDRRTHPLVGGRVLKLRRKHKSLWPQGHLPHCPASRNDQPQHQVLKFHLSVNVVFIFKFGVPLRV